MSDLRVDIATLEGMTNAIEGTATGVTFDGSLAHPNSSAFGSPDVISAVNSAAKTLTAMAKTLGESVSSQGAMPKAAAAEFAATDTSLGSSAKAGL